MFEPEIIAKSLTIIHCVCNSKNISYHLFVHLHVITPQRKGFQKLQQNIHLFYLFDIKCDTFTAYCIKQLPTSTNQIHLVIVLKQIDILNLNHTHTTNWYKFNITHNQMPHTYQNVPEKITFSVFVKHTPTQVLQLQMCQIFYFFYFFNSR